MSAIALSNGALASMPDNVSRPKYRRSDVTPGILHIGVGNFHRAHQGAYLDRLFNMGSGHDWGIIGAGIRPNDRQTRDALLGQDCLSTIIELDPAGYSATISGSMIGFLPIAPDSIMRALTRPEIRIVSLTITEGGYFLDSRTGRFDLDHRDIVYDLEHPDKPRTVFGVLLAGLKYRYDAGLAPFTIVSCDNLPGNGHIVRQALDGLSGAAGPALQHWIAEFVRIPNGMVDCITPATGERERALSETEFGIKDDIPVVCEPFRQWVLEDHFSAGRPALEKVGVEFVDDVAPHELMKLRILNGGHAAIAYAGALLGHHFVHDAMGDPLILAYLDRLERTEIIPTLEPIPGVDFHAYLASVVGRFSNPRIGDTISRLCLDGSNRQPKFILPAIAERAAEGLPVDGLALEVAFWCRYCAGRRDDASPITIEDENAHRLQEFANRARNRPVEFLSMTDVFGSLKDNEVFAAAFSRALNAIYENGAAATLNGYVMGDQA